MRAASFEACIAGDFAVAQVHLAPSPLIPNAGARRHFSLDRSQTWLSISPRSIPLNSIPSPASR
jgi:hypothetical protein